MSVSLNKETKTNIGLDLEGKSNSPTWDEATWTWDEATGPWDNPGSVLTKETKTNTSLNLETK